VGAGGRGRHRLATSAALATERRPGARGHEHPHRPPRLARLATDTPGDRREKRFCFPCPHARRATCSLVSRSSLRRDAPACPYTDLQRQRSVTSRSRSLSAHASTLSPPSDRGEKIHLATERRAAQTKCRRCLRSSRLVCLVLGASVVDGSVSCYCPCFPLCVACIVFLPFLCYDCFLFVFVVGASCVFT